MIAQVDQAYFKINPTAASRRFVSRLFFEGRPITTGSRWINHLVFAHFWLEKRLPQLKKVIKPIFIIGTGRSGTTILGSILSIHNQVGYLNEPKALWHAANPDEDVIGHYSHGYARYRLNAEDVTPEARHNIHRLFGAFLATTFTKRIVDKNPELAFRIPYVKAIFPDALFIFLVRNGWNTCYSIANWSKNNEVKIDGEIHDWWGVNNRKWSFMLSELVAPDPVFADTFEIISGFKLHTDMAAVEWVVTMREGMRLLSIDSSIHLLRYEDLTQNPRQILIDLMDQCDLPHDSKVLTYAEKVLNPSTDHPPLELHPAILPIFNSTLDQMGY
jgi:hypothetical protein